MEIIIRCFAVLYFFELISKLLFWERNRRQAIKKIKEMLGLEIPFFLVSQKEREMIIAFIRYVLIKKASRFCDADKLQEHLSKRFYHLSKNEAFCEIEIREINRIFGNISQNNLPDFLVQIAKKETQKRKIVKNKIVLFIVYSFL